MPQWPELKGGRNEWPFRSFSIQKLQSTMLGHRNLVCSNDINITVCRANLSNANTYSMHSRDTFWKRNIARVRNCPDIRIFNSVCSWSWSWSWSTFNLPLMIVPCDLRHFSVCSQFVQCVLCHSKTKRHEYSQNARLCGVWRPGRHRSISDTKQPHCGALWIKGRK